jgi:putative transcriptional regulator
MSLVGRLLIAAPNMFDENFVRAVVLICAHDENGALGVVLNRPTEIPVVDHLPEWVEAAASPPVVFLGGPVQVEVAVGLATSQSVIEEWTPVVGDTGLIDLSTCSPGSVIRARVYAGYTGWGAGQLESEVDRADWLVVAAHADDPFDDDPPSLRRRVLARQSDSIRLYANYPEDPRLN